MRAVLCPVCNGKGVIYGIAESGAYPSTQCHGCGGKGWVEVSNDPPQDWNWKYPYPGVTISIPGNDPTRCPACGGDRNDPTLTGCPKGSHYGAYCLV